MDERLVWIAECACLVAVVACQDPEPQPVSSEAAWIPQESNGLQEAPQRDLTSADEFTAQELTKFPDESFTVDFRATGRCSTRIRELPIQRFRSFGEAARNLQAGLRTGRVRTHSEAEAVDLLCPDQRCPAEHGWIFRLGDSAELERVYLGWRAPTGGAVLVGHGEGGRCAGTDRLELVRAQWPFILRGDQDRADFPESDCAPGTIGLCSTYCLDQFRGSTIVIVTEQRALQIETQARHDSMVDRWPPLRVRAHPDGLMVDGCGWHEHIVRIALTNQEHDAIREAEPSLRLWLRRQ